MTLIVLKASLNSNRLVLWLKTGIMVFRLNNISEAFIWWLSGRA